MSHSLKLESLLSYQTLQDRLILVRELQSSESEGYDILKDQLTGEHYLHYAYLHIDVSQQGIEETFHHFMPISSDEVLALALGEGEFQYPQHWKEPYLRNGPEDHYVWFDPSHEEKYEDDALFADEVVRKLAELRAKGNIDLAAIQEYFRDLDKRNKE
jgi:hypothetical protein